jgi:dolichol-phosphate mannosyltransferase
MDPQQKENFSIIIPTYYEAKNLPELAANIAAVNFGDRQFEVILADDDSQDGTPEVVQQLSVTYPWLKLMTRRKKRDLSLSILEGCQMAIYPVLITMDADLSHPPEKIIDMLTILADPAVDAVIGSRYMKGGSTDPSWPMTRVYTSKFGALIARALLVLPIKDPLSGFLAIRKKTLLRGGELKPIGWKVGLEIIIKCHCKNVREIPIHFSQRKHGQSKLTFKISFDYLHHVMILCWHKMFAL